MSFYCARTLARICTIAWIFPAHLYLLTISAFYLTGGGLHLPQGICCRMVVELHQTRASLYPRKAGK